MIARKGLTGENTSTTSLSALSSLAYRFANAAGSTLLWAIERREGENMMEIKIDANQGELKRTRTSESTESIDQIDPYSSLPRSWSNTHVAMRLVLLYVTLHH